MVTCNGFGTEVFWHSNFSVLLITSLLWDLNLQKQYLTERYGLVQYMYMVSHWYVGNRKRQLNWDKIFCFSVLINKENNSTLALCRRYKKKKQKIEIISSLLAEISKIRLSLVLLIGYQHMFIKHLKRVSNDFGNPLPGLLNKEMLFFSIFTGSTGKLKQHHQKLGTKDVS